MQNNQYRDSTQGQNRHSLRQRRIEVRPPQPCADRARLALKDWRETSQGGDFARAIWAPCATARAAYGSPVSPVFCHVLENIVGGGDLALINTGDQILAVMPLQNFVALAEAAQ